VMCLILANTVVIVVETAYVRQKSADAIFRHIETCFT